MLLFGCQGSVLPGPRSGVHRIGHKFIALELFEVAGYNFYNIPQTVQDNLGHATAAFTLDKYDHVSERMRSESAERMDDYISKI